VQRFEAVYGRVLDALALIACALILGMTLMICADVFLRNTRVLPGLVGLEWANEISEAMLFLVTLLTAPWLLRRGQHIRVDIIVRAVPPRFKAGSLSIKTLITPEWWLLSVLPAAFALLTLEMLFRMRRLYLGPRAPRDDAVSTG
jgi:TRAP-type transport system small permease protein